MRKAKGRRPTPINISPSRPVRGTPRSASLPVPRTLGTSGCQKASELHQLTQEPRTCREGGTPRESSRPTTEERGGPSQVNKQPSSNQEIGRGVEGMDLTTREGQRGAQQKLRIRQRYRIILPKHSASSLVVRPPAAEPN